MLFFCGMSAFRVSKRDWGKALFLCCAAGFAGDIRTSVKNFHKREYNTGGEPKNRVKEGVKQRIEVYSEGRPPEPPPERKNFCSRNFFRRCVITLFGMGVQK
jgi:hypothetical protein